MLACGLVCCVSRRRGAVARCSQKAAAAQAVGEEASGVRGSIPR